MAVTSHDLIRDRATSPILQRHAEERSAAELRRVLEQPLKMPKDPPMKIRALCEFGLGFGRTAKAGEVVEVLSSTGRMLISINRAEEISA